MEFEGASLGLSIIEKKELPILAQNSLTKEILDFKSLTSQLNKG